MSIAVGADIESICSKCGDVWHVVVAMVGPKVAKVQCKQCSGYHRYKAPGGKAAAKAPAKKRAPRKSAKAEPALPAGPLVQIDPNADVRPYSMHGEFKVGDHISHPRCGVGVVEMAAEPGKIGVWFPDGRKVLAVVKRESALAVAGDHKPFRE